MATWTVHCEGDDLAAAIAADRLVVLREGMSAAALIVPFAWALWHRLWLVFLGWCAVTVAIEAADRFVDPALGFALSFGFVIWFAVAANDLRRWTLERCGWRLAAIVEGRDRDEAETRFFLKVADPRRVHAGEVVTPPPAHGPDAATRSRPTTDLPPIVGFAGLSGGRP